MKFGGFSRQNRTCARYCDPSTYPFMYAPPYAYKESFVRPLGCAAYERESAELTWIQTRTGILVAALTLLGRKTWQVANC